MYNMIMVRRAEEKDKGPARKMLKDVDIFYNALEFKDFWVAEDGGEVVGCAQLEELPGFFYLGSVATAPSAAGKGIARSMLDKLLKGLSKDTYLYTVIPDFFKKFKFSVCQPIPGLPSKDRYECEDCHADRCVCMVRPKET
jgi:N-acetylglutamate synthase-like GNAT family acetyltransferase